MRKTRKAPAIFFGAALAAALLGVILSFTAAGSSPVLLRQPEEARTAARELLDSAAAGDFQAVSSHLLGHPSLGDRETPEDPAASLLWQEFLSSLTYEIQGDCYGSDTGVALDVQVSYLDFHSVMEPLGRQTKRLLNRRVSQARDVSEVYDRNNHFREEVVRQVLEQALEAALKTDGKTITRQITLSLVYEEGRWLVLPEPDILSVISGGTVR